MSNPRLRLVFPIILTAFTVFAWYRVLELRPIPVAPAPSPASAATQHAPNPPTSSPATTAADENAALRRIVDEMSWIKPPDDVRDKIATVAAKHPGHPVQVLCTSEENDSLELAQWIEKILNKGDWQTGGRVSRYHVPDAMVAVGIQILFCYGDGTKPIDPEAALALMNVFKETGYASQDALMVLPTHFWAGGGGGSTVLVGIRRRPAIQT